MLFCPKYHFIVPTEAKTVLIKFSLFDEFGEEGICDLPYLFLYVVEPDDEKLSMSGQSFLSFSRLRLWQKVNKK